MTNFLRLLLFCFPLVAHAQFKFSETSMLLHNTWHPGTVTFLSGEKLACEIQFNLVGHTTIIPVRKDGIAYFIPIEELYELTMYDSLMGRERSFVSGEDKHGWVRLLELEYRTKSGAIVIAREIRTTHLQDQHGATSYLNSKMEEEKYLLNTSTRKALPLSPRNLFRLFESKKGEIRSFCKIEKISFAEYRDYFRILRHLDTLK